jgi:acetoin utilization deacetylase AcuC-like enzyme
MMEIKQKLELSFKLIEPEISAEKAYELLSDPEINSLIYLDIDKTIFYYITEREISVGINNNHINEKLQASDIAKKSFVFDYDQYSKNHINYLIEFKKKLSKLGLKKLNKFLITSNGLPMGLVSDLAFEDLPDSAPVEYKSQLDIFIDSELDPEANINMFYDSISALGFDLTQEIKDHILKVLNERLTEQENNENSGELPEVPELHPDRKPSTDVPEIQTETSTEDRSGGLVIIYHPAHISHRSKGTSPEMPERLIKIMDLLKRREKVFSSDCRLISDFSAANEEDLLRVHTKKYIAFVKSYAAKGGGFLGDSTYITKTTHELALLAAGGALRAAEEVLNRNADFGLALIRPPGHHASKDKYGGYCIYNNAAVLARYLQKKKELNKILIIDWDAHAANGTLDIFYDDPSVMLISIHQDPHTFYPKTGFSSQLGKSSGLGYTINMEMPRGAGDEEYLRTFNELVLPIYKKFNPDFVIGCNGFDPHHSDQFTDLHLTSKGYYEFCKIFRKHMIGKMVILMEGGYNPYMGELTLTLINGLLGQPNQFDDKHQSLFHKVISDEKINVVFNNKLNELKNNLKHYNVI